MLVLVRNGLTDLSLHVSLGLEKSVGWEYGCWKDAASVFVVHLCLESLSNEHTCWLCWLKMVWLYYLCMWAWHWKICRREMQAIKSCCGCFQCPFMFIISIYWTYLMAVLVGNWIASTCQPWPWKICWREIRAIDHKRSCVCLICPCTFAAAGIWSVDVDRVLIRLTKLTAASWIFKDNATKLHKQA